MFQLSRLQGHKDLRVGTVTLHSPCYHVYGTSRANFFANEIILKFQTLFMHGAVGVVCCVSISSIVWTKSP